MAKKGRLPWWMITILLAILGGVSGFIYSQMDRAGWFIRWQRIGTLPEKPRQFLGFKNYSWNFKADFLIELASGNIYQYNSGGDVWYEWQAAEPYPDYVRDLIAHDCALVHSTGLPGKVSLCKYLEWDHGAGRQTYYVVLEDQSVWTRLVQPGWASAGICGWYELAGICVGWLAILVYRRRPLKANWGLKTGYLLLGVFLTAALIGLFMAVSPTAISFEFAVLFAGLANLTPALCFIIIAAMPVSAVVIFWLRHKK